MNVPEILKSLGDRLGGSATVKNVYGEPITSGDRTVVPVARISYAFGGGGGGPEGDRAIPSGGGGGGYVSAKPCGALEITPGGALEITPGGARFIHFSNWSLGAALAVGFALGAMVGRRRLSILKE
jgi:uncharacterized spore protein YtfJ